MDILIGFFLFTSLGINFLMWRTMKVGQFRSNLIDQIGKAFREDILELSRKTGSQFSMVMLELNRKEKARDIWFNSVSWDEMVFKFWKPLGSFYSEFNIKTALTPKQQEDFEKVQLEVPEIAKRIINDITETLKKAGFEVVNSEFDDAIKVQKKDDEVRDDEVQIGQYDGVLDEVREEDSVLDETLINDDRVH